MPDEVEELGECEFCHGRLCVRGPGIQHEPDGRTIKTPAEVCCEICGQPQPGHPFAAQIKKEWDEHDKAAASRAPRPEPDFRVPLVTDATDALKRLVASKACRLNRLADQLQPVATVPTERKGKR